MKYFVKNDDGELCFGSIHELRAMFAQGLVAPEDEVRAEDSQIWRKAAAVPELRAYAASRKDSGEFRFLLVALVCLSGGLFVLFGHSSLGLTARVLVAAALMVPVLGMSQRAFTRSMKRERK